jgi:hypothetical protein
MLLNKFIQQLDSSKFTVDYISCGSAFQDFCTVKESKGRELNQNTFLNKIDCFECKFSARLSSNVINVRRFDVTNFYHLEDLLGLDNRDLESKLTLELDSKNDIDVNFELFGTPIVRFALYETVIKYKKLDFHFNAEQHKYLRLAVANSIKTTLAARNLFKKSDDFHALICHSPEYGANNSFLDQATKFGIPTYSLRGSGNLDEMSSSAMVWQWNTLEPEVSPASSNWNLHNVNQVLQDDELRINNHISQLSMANSPFVYSAKSNKLMNINTLHNVFGIKDDEIYVLLSLSSTDEVFAGNIIGRGTGARYPGVVYQDQFDWVKDTIKYFENKKKTKLIIRLHPRDLPNKRDSLTSEQYSRWNELLTNLPDNVLINHPDQKIAFQDLCKGAKGLITGWSSTALEALLLGIPVVTYDSSLPGFPANIHLTGSSKSEYYANINKILSNSSSDIRTEDVIKWLAHSLNHGSVKLSGRLFEKTRSRGPVWVRKIFSGLDRYFFFIWRPLEILLTSRKSPDARRINNLIAELKQDLYQD